MLGLCGGLLPSSNDAPIRRQSGSTAKFSAIQEIREMVRLDESCIAHLSASVSPARATSGPGRTYARTLGERALRL